MSPKLLPLDWPDQFDPSRVFLRFSPSGKRLFVSNDECDPWGIVLDVASGKPLHQFTDPDGLKGAIFLNDDRLLLFCRGKNSVYDVAGKHEVNWQGEMIPGQDGWDSPDPNVIVTGGNDFCLYDHVSQKVVHRFRSPNEGNVRCVGFSPDGRYLAADSGEHRSFRFLQLWDLRTKKLFRIYELANSMYESDSRMIAISPDNRTLAVCIYGYVGWYGIEHVERILPLSECEAAVSLQFSADGRTLEVVSADGKISWLDAQTGQVLQEAPPPECLQVAMCAITKKRLAAGIGENALVFWQLPDWADAEPVRPSE